MCVCIFIIVCDIETSTIRRPMSVLDYCATEYSSSSFEFLTEKIVISFP